MKFIMLVGLPGAGKSTFAEQYKNKNFIIHSPDILRNELNLHSLDDTQKIFNILYKNILVDMKNNKNILYDSTNLTVKRRIMFLKLIKDFNYKKICYVIDTPLDICKYRNNKRIGYSKVEDKEYRRMESIYEKPTYNEGWDIIIYFKNT